MKNKKGFTLVELLVVIVILGIITGMSIPLIRNLQVTMSEKKYTAYLTSLKTSAKLYNDSYYEDLFGHNETGVVCLTYKELEEKNLLKDIGIDDVSCNHENTFVRITKLKDKYVYVPYMTCGKKENGKASTVEKVLPENSTEKITDEFCSQNVDSTIKIDANPMSGLGKDKKRRKTQLTIKSVTGIYNKIVIYTAWSTTTTPPSTGWKKVDFKVEGNQKQKLLNGETISTTSKELVTPQGENGKYYLHVRVDQLKDLYGNKWKNEKDKDSKYTYFGAFEIDNTPPTCPTITATASNKAYTLNTWTKENIKFTFKFDDDTNSYKWFTNTGNGAYTDWGSNSKIVTTKEISGEGIRHIKLIVYDLAKNKKECEYATKNYNIDKTAPKCGAATGASRTWTNSNRTIQQACADSLSSCVKPSYDTTYSTTTVKGSVTIADNAGNTALCNYDVYVDKTNPTKPSISNPSGGNWQKSNFSLTLESTDQNSGIAYYQYTYAANATSTGSDNTKQWVTYANSNKTSFKTTEFSAQRNQYVYVRSCDVAGNCSDKNQTYIRIDKTKPTCSEIKKIGSSNGSNYTNSNLTCSNVYTSANCNDTGGSGCASKKTVTTTGKTTNVTNQKKESLTIKAKGTSTATWKVYDNAGNSATCSKITVKKGTESVDDSCDCKTYKSCQNSACGKTASAVYKNLFVPSTMTCNSYNTTGIKWGGYSWYSAGSGTGCKKSENNADGPCCRFKRTTYTTDTCRTKACGCEKHKKCCHS